MPRQFITTTNAPGTVETQAPASPTAHRSDPSVLEVVARAWGGRMQRLTRTVRSLCRAAFRSSRTPARASVVAYPMRKEWAVMGQLRMHTH